LWRLEHLSRGDYAERATLTPERERTFRVNTWSPRSGDAPSTFVVQVPEKR
jgi:hypothetical protein